MITLLANNVFLPPVFIIEPGQGVPGGGGENFLSHFSARIGNTAPEGIFFFFLSADFASFFFINYAMTLMITV